MNKVLFVLCEGPHDVAFLYRIFKVLGFNHYNKNIIDYPQPLNEYLKNEIIQSHLNIDGCRIEDVNNALLPREVVCGDVLVLLYALGGDSRKDLRTKLINDLFAIYKTSFDEKHLRYTVNSQCSISYFFDADNIGVDKRYIEINKELHDILGANIELSVDKKCEDFCGIKFSAFIFSKEDDDMGKLEDILIPLMRHENNEVFDDAFEYVRKHYDVNRRYRLDIRFHEDGNITEERGKNKGSFDETKSVIGVVGQLQNSGSTNQVCIKHSDYITFPKIMADKSCCRILDYFRALL